MDPSAGLFTDEYYVPVATSFNPDLAMPVNGNYRGNCHSSLEANVEITILD